MKLSRMTAEEYINEKKDENAKLIEDIDSKKGERAELEGQCRDLLKKRDELNAYLAKGEEELNIKRKLLEIRQQDINDSEVKLNTQVDQIKEMRKQLETEKQDLIIKAKLYEEKDFYRQEEVDKKSAEISKLKDEYFIKQDVVNEQIRKNAEENIKIVQLQEATKKEYDLAVIKGQELEQAKKGIEDKEKELWNRTVEIAKVEKGFYARKEEVDIRDKTLDVKEKDLQMRERQQEEYALSLEYMRKRTNELIEQYHLKGQLNKENLK